MNKTITKIVSLLPKSKRRFFTKVSFKAWLSFYDNHNRYHDDESYDVLLFGSEKGAEIYIPFPFTGTEDTQDPYIVSVESKQFIECIKDYLNRVE